MNGSPRAATAADAERIQLIEAAADALLIDALGAPEWPDPDDAVQRIGGTGFVLVLDDPDQPHSPIGFAHVLDADGLAHLSQLSVLPEFTRQGHGRRLLLAAMEEARRLGYTRITLSTYAEIPWNAPFYASCGFLESLPETPFLREVQEVESTAGIDRYGRRLLMTAEL